MHDPCFIEEPFAHVVTWKGTELKFEVKSASFHNVSLNHSFYTRGYICTERAKAAKKMGPTADAAGDLPYPLAPWHFRAYQPDFHISAFLCSGGLSLATGPALPMLWLAGRAGELRHRQ